MTLIGAINRNWDRSRNICPACGGYYTYDELRNHMANKARHDQRHKEACMGFYKTNSNVCQ